MENKNRVIQAIRSALRDNTINPLSVMSVVTAGMEELAAIRTMTGPEKLTTLQAALRDIASGADGIANTADDLIPPATLAAINQILDTGLLGDVVDAVLNASRGRYDFGRVVETASRIDPAALWIVAKPAIVCAAGWLVWRILF
jgi:hypothetical protein